MLMLATPQCSLKWITIGTQESRKDFRDLVPPVYLMEEETQSRSHMSKTSEGWVGTSEV